MSRLNQVKDIFIFSCFTGLAYSDVKKMSHENIAIGIDGEKWLFVNRTKTDTASRVPLLPTAIEILESIKIIHSASTKNDYCLCLAIKK